MTHDLTTVFKDVHWLMDVLQSIDVGLVVMNRHYEIELWNSFMQNHSAKVPSEVMGHTLFEVFPELPESWFKRKSQTVFVLQTPTFTTWEQRPYLVRFEHYRPITGMAEHMFQNSTIIPLLDSQANVEHICLIIYDVTDTAINKLGMESANEQLEALSQTDHLTGLNNRGHWEKCLYDEFKRYQRYDAVSSLVILDIDHFKNINDTYGHTVGDDAIRAVSQIIQEASRDVDIPGRYGGEEFCIILPGTDEAGAITFSNRLRQQIEGMVVESEGHSVKFTISLGVCQAHPKLTTPTSWIEQADQGLYQSKENGRNQVNSISV